MNILVLFSNIALVEFCTKWIPIKQGPSVNESYENGNKRKFEKDLVNFCKKDTKTTESVSEQPIQLKFKLNSSLWQIIATINIPSTINPCPSRFSDLPMALNHGNRKHRRVTFWVIDTYKSKDGNVKFKKKLRTTHF